jgi:hypothetical protein
VQIVLQTPITVYPVFPQVATVRIQGLCIWKRSQHNSTAARRSRAKLGRIQTKTRLTQRRLALSRGEHGYRKGQYAWSSELVQRAFNGVGGRHYFNHALIDSAMADRAHFTRIYNELLEREEKARREAPAVAAYRRAMSGDGPAEDRSKRPRVIAVDVEEERRLPAAGDRPREAEGLPGPGEGEAPVEEQPEAVAETGEVAIKDGAWVYVTVVPEFGPQRRG